MTDTIQNLVPTMKTGCVGLVVAANSHESATFRGGGATFAGGWPDELRGNAFWIFPAQTPTPKKNNPQPAEQECE